MQRGYELKELAEIYGHRSCCKKGTCIHKKAKQAIDKITELETALETCNNDLIETLKYRFETKWICGVLDKYKI